MADTQTRIGWMAALLALLLAVAFGVAACGDDDDDGGGDQAGADQESGTIALLLPESKTARYESQDRPNFERRVQELCPDCEIFYQNANQDTSRQQSQVEAAITRTWT